MARAPSASTSFSIALCLRWPLFDQRSQPDRIVLQPVAVPRQHVALGGDVPAHIHQLAEIGGKFLRASAQFGDDRSEQHGGAQRLQRVSGRTKSAGGVRRPGTLQGRQHLDDFGAA